VSSGALNSTHSLTQVSLRPSWTIQKNTRLHLLAWLGNFLIHSYKKIVKAFFVVGCSEPTSLSHQHWPLETQRNTGSAHHRRRPHNGMHFVSSQGTIEVCIGSRHLLKIEQWRRLRKGVPPTLARDQCPTFKFVPASLWMCGVIRYHVSERTMFCKIWCIFVAMLNVTRWLTGSQCSCCSAGLIIIIIIIDLFAIFSYQLVDTYHAMAGHQKTTKFN